MQIKIIKAESYNWYKVGEVYLVKDKDKYENMGLQIYREDNGRVPDVIMHGDYEEI